MILNDFVHGKATLSQVAFAAKRWMTIKGPLHADVWMARMVERSQAARGASLVGEQLGIGGAAVGEQMRDLPHWGRQCPGEA